MSWMCKVSGKVWVVVASIMFAISATVMLSSMPAQAYAVAERTVSGDDGSVHIFAFQNSDAILVESNGLFGMIDSGEDDDYPDGSDPRYPFREGTTVGQGHQDEVISYLRQQGVKPGNFVFYIGTHAHSDHIGSADEIIRTFKPKCVYTPLYDDSFVTNPGGLWDNQYVYDRMLEAASDVGAQVFQQLSPEQRTFTLGNLTISIENYRDIDENFRVDGPNNYCWGVKVADDANSIFLAGDIDNTLGAEDKLAQTLGHVDVLKLGHHGFIGSNTPDYIHALAPKLAISTGSKIYIPDDTADALLECGARVISYDEIVEEGKQAITLTFTGSGVDSNVSYAASDLWFEVRSSSPFVTAYRNFKPVALNGWYKDGNRWYWFEKTTTAVEDAWRSIGGKWYYLQPNAVMGVDWVNVHGAWYFFNGSGAMQTGWIQLGGTWYYLSGSGAMLTGWQRINGAWYYLDPSSGAMQTGWELIDGTWYYLSGSGAMLTGWQRINGAWYYLSGSGAMTTGWQWIGGTWYYLKDSGAMATGWELVDGATWYYMNGSGAMQTGWLNLGGTWYYLNGSGAMATGWAKVGGAWYYLRDNGSMATGWVQDTDGKWYYTSGSGAMQTGWLYTGGTWYYLNGSGAMATGWAKVGGTWYYLRDNGSMATGWVQDTDGKWYYTSGSGAMQTGWLHTGGVWYYLNGSGVMATGWQSIGGTDYFFNESGAWVEHPTAQDLNPAPQQPQAAASAKPAQKEESAVSIDRAETASEAAPASAESLSANGVAAEANEAVAEAVEAESASAASGQAA